MRNINIARVFQPSWEKKNKTVQTQKSAPKIHPTNQWSLQKRQRKEKSTIES